MRRWSCRKYVFPSCAVDGFSYILNISVITIWLGVTLASQRAIGRGYAALLVFIPALVGAVLVNTLSSQNKVGLLVSYWISSEPVFQHRDQIAH